MFNIAPIKITPIKRYSPGLFAMVAFLMVSTADLVQPNPVQSRELIKVAQVLDSASPQAGNAETVVRNFLTLLAQQQFEQAVKYVSPTVSGYGSPTQLQQLWQKIIRTDGPLAEIRSIYATNLSGNYTVIATVRFQNATEDLTFELDPAQKITEANFLWLGNMQTAAENFVVALAKGDYAIARSYLAPSLKDKFLPDTIKQRWESVISRVGPFKRLKGASLIRGGSYDVVQLDLEFEQSSGKFFVFFNPLSQITGFDSPLKPR